MTVRYGWVDDHKLIMNIYLESPWTWKQYNEMVDAIMPMISAANHPCATVVLTHKMRALPKDGNALQNLLRVEKMMPDNMFVSCIVGTPMVVKVFMDLVMRLRPHVKNETFFVSSEAEAHERIQAIHRELFPELADE